MNQGFGVFINPERINYSDIKTEVQHVEKLGYDSIWMSDHVFGLIGNQKNPFFECWTTLSAIATETTQIKLGQLVLCNPFRHPSLLAKMGATLDSISKGRLILGLGTGWAEEEFKSYGYPFDKPAVRVRKVAEASQIIRKMWTLENPYYIGRYYKVENAYCYPKPIQQPSPPIMIAGGGEKLTLKAVARYADWSNFTAWLGTTKAFRSKVNVMKKYCTKVNRTIEDITKSFATYVIIGDSYSELREKEKYFKKVMVRRWGSGFKQKAPLFGKPDQIIQQISDYRGAGVDYFILRFMGGNFMEEAKFFAKKVLPYT